MDIDRDVEAIKKLVSEFPAAFLQVARLKGGIGKGKLIGLSWTLLPRRSETTTLMCQSPLWQWAQRSSSRLSPRNPPIPMRPGSKGSPP